MQEDVDRRIKARAESLRLRVATWNLNSRRDVTPQIDALAAHNLDVVTLQEVTIHTWPRLEPALIHSGFPHVLSSVSAATSGPRRYGLVIASKFPISSHESGIDVPWPERVLCARVEWKRTVFFGTTHIPPGSSNGPETKSGMLEAAYQQLLRLTKEGPTLFTGDFNAPREERAEGVITWGQRINAKGEVVPRGGPEYARQHAAELAWFQNAAVFDVFRALHPDELASSWVLKRSTGNIPRRFDHVFACDRWKPVSAEYDNGYLEARLSDHAPLLVTMQLNVPS